MNGYSYTSNVVKLLKHLNKMQSLQDGVVSPIMVHTIPTHRCQLNCVHCCFKNRKDKKEDIPLEWWKEGMKQFNDIGTKALEYTGGGDPTLWPYINEGSEYAHSLGYHMGCITNGVSLDKVES